MQKVKFNCAVNLDSKKYARNEVIEVDDKQAKELVARLGKRVSISKGGKSLKTNDKKGSVLDGLKKPELVTLCEKAELDTDGTTADLKARLELEVDDLNSLIEE